MWHPGFRRDSQQEPKHGGTEALERKRALGALDCSDGGLTATQDLGLGKGKWGIPAVIISEADKQPCNKTEQVSYTTLIHFEIRFSRCIVENLKIKEKTIKLCCSCFNSTFYYSYIDSLPAMLVPVAINVVLSHLLNLNIQQGTSLAEYFLFQSQNYTPLTNSVL